MEAIYIVKHGAPQAAFEKRPLQLGKPQAGEVQVEVEAFGLNFADVMARLGHYRDCPPLPAIVGYEVVGRISEIGEGVSRHKKGDRVVAFTRFGAYAQFVNTIADGVVKLDEGYDTGKALALATQYCTAFYAACVATNVLPGEKVLIQAAAGGVGTALVQLCKLKDCFIYGTAGSDDKLQYAREQGVDVPINYRKEDFTKVIKEPLDVVFDSLGGKTFRDGLNLLDKGGRMVAYGAASQTETSNIFGKVKFGLDFGIYHPAQFIMNCRTLVGVNMLRIADHKTYVLKHCLESVVDLAHQGKIDPHVGGMYDLNQLNEAHLALENRKTVGKIGVYWK